MGQAMACGTLPRQGLLNGRRIGLRGIFFSHIIHLLACYQGCG
jgi:hypothetical protein